MKKIIHLIACAVMFAAFSNFASAQTEKQIKQIRADVNLINKNAPKYTKKIKTVEDIALEGTEATYFASGRSLKKITAKMFGETYNATVEMYFSGEAMIFAFLKENRYDTQIGMNPPPKVISSEEKRFYFSDGKPIRLLAGKKELKPENENYRQLQAQIADIAEKLKAAY